MPLLCIEQVWKEYNIFENVSFIERKEVLCFNNMI